MEWMIRVDIQAGKSIHEIMKKKTDTCIKPAQNIIFTKRLDLNVKQIGTEQV